MLATSTKDKNSSLVHISFFDCLDTINVGSILTYIGMSLSFFLGTPAYSWFLWFFLRVGWKIKPTEIFRLTLTGVNLLYCMSMLLVLLKAILFHSSVVLAAIYFFYGFHWFCRPLLHMFHCIEQYLAVLHPVIFLRYKGIQYRIESAGVVVFMALGYGMCLAFSLVSFPDPIFIFVFFTNVIVISFCCVSVLCALRRPSPGDRRITTNQQKRNAFKTIFAALIVVLIGYLPLVSTVIFNVAKTDEKVFECDIFPLMALFDIYCVMFPPLLKLMVALIHRLGRPVVMSN